MSVGKRIVALVLFCLVLVDCQDMSKDGATKEYLKQYQDQKAPLAIDYHSPVGQVAVSNNQIVVHFSQPMVALGEVGQVSNKQFLRIEPTLAGTYKWVNTKTLVFTTKGYLPFATDFKVTVLSGKESLLGMALLKEFAFDFKTPVPEVISISPTNASQQIALKQKFTIGFNQMLDAAKVVPFVELMADNKPVAFTLVCEGLDADGKVPTQCARVGVTPVEELTKDVVVNLTIKKGVLGIEGKNPSLYDVSYSFRTHSDFNLADVICGKICRPGAALTITATTPLSNADISKFITFEPPLDSSTSLYGYWSEYQQSFVIYPHTKPNTSYRVTLKEGLKDVFGQTLKTQFVREFQTGHYDASLDLPYVTDRVMRFSDKTDFGFFATNINVATVNLKTTLSDVDIINLNQDQRETLEKMGASGWDKTIEVSGEVTDKATFHPLPMTENFPGRTSGIFLAEYTSPQIMNYNQTKQIWETVKNILIHQVTDLGIDAKLSDKDGLVWVTSLASGESISQARVKIYNRFGDLLFQGLTDAQGFIKTPGFFNLKVLSEKAYAKKVGDSEASDVDEDPMPYSIFAEKGTDRAYITNDWTDGLGYYSYYDMSYYEEVSEAKTGDDTTEKDEQTTPAAEPVTLRAHLLTDRGLYKPGEEVQIKGYVREVGKTGLVPYNKPLAVSIAEPRGDKPLQFDVTPNARGNFNLTFSVGTEASLGYYEVKLLSGDEAITIDYGFTSFQVEKFRTPEFKVEVKAKAQNYFRGDEIKADISGEYLFGAPMKKATTNYMITKMPTSFSPANDQDWQFGRLYEHTHNDEDTTLGDYIDESDVLSAKGSLALTMDATYTLPDPVHYNVEATVYDLSSQSQSARTTILIHPASFYIGAKLEHLFFNEGEKVTTTFSTLKPDGSLVTGGQVKAEVVRVKWVSVKEETLDAEYETKTRREETVVTSCEKTVAGPQESCDFTVSESGYYFVKLTSVDEKKYDVITEVPFYVTGKSYAYWPSEDSSTLEIVPDKKSYQVGDTAKLLIKSPYQKARALVSLERDHIMSYFTYNVESSSPVIDLPIKDVLAPNVFVKVVLIKGALDLDQSQTPSKQSEEASLVKAGMVELAIAPQNKGVKVKITPRAKIYHPGDEVTVDFAVDGLNPKNESEITVMVVDEGVLLAGGYALTDPLETFFAPYRFSVMQMDARTRYVSQQGLENKLAQASSGGGFDAAFRKNFIPLAYFNGELNTVDGKASVTFTIPEQLTTFKIMAIANAEIDRFGLGFGDFKTQKEIMLRPALPRFLRPGDDFDSKIVVHNNTKENLKDIKVTVTAKGLEIKSGDEGTVDIAPQSSTVYHVKAGLPKESVDAKPVDVMITASAKNYHDAVQITIPTYADRDEEVVATSGATIATATEFFDKAGDVDPNFGGLEISLSSNLTSKMTDAIRLLRVYPYDCLEQRLSKIYPLVLFPTQDRFFSGPDKDAKVRDEKVGAFINYIKSAQNYDGEFSLWPGSAPNPMLTIMVGEFLIAAKANGHDVDEVLNRIRPLLFSYLKYEANSVANYSQGYKEVLRLNALYLMAQMGEAQPSYYAEFRISWQSFDFMSQARLMELLSAENKDDPLVKAWLAGLNQTIRIKGDTAYVDELYSNDYYLSGSSRVATATTLSALLKLDPAHPFVLQMVKFIAEEKRAGDYASSLDTLAVIKSLDLFLKMFPTPDKPINALVTLNDKELFKSLLSADRPADTVNLPIDKLPERGKIGLTTENSALLFYDMKYRYALKTPRGYGIEQGISYTREYHDLDGNLVEAKDFKLGESYKTTLNLYFNDDVHSLVIEDPVPAGFEPVNFALNTARQGLSNNSTYDGGLWWYISHKQFHDKKIEIFADYVPRGFYSFSYYINVTNAGDFSTPAAKALEMYHPEVFGTAAAGAVEIK